MAPTTIYTMLQDPEMKEIVESFLVETKEILESLDVDLIEMEKKPDDSELLNKVFRSFHTIKGTSGFLGLEKIPQVTHKCEDLLNKLRKGEVKLNSSLMDGILLAYDHLKSLMTSVEENQNEDVPVENVINILAGLINEIEQGQNAEPVQTKTEKPKSKRKKKDKTSEKIEEKSEEKPEQKILENHAVELLEEAEEKPAENTIKKPVENVEHVSVQNNSADKKEDNNIRVDVKRLDELLNIASELVLGRNRLLQVNSEMIDKFEGTEIAKNLSETAKQIDLMTNELQLVVMKTRMIKIGKIFNRYPRIVRDLSKETNKKVLLELRGEDTELDKTLIEEINDPLVHLIRNAVDHGIEKPEVRKAAGKEETGTVILSAEHEGNNIIITVEDDGKGIDPEVIKEKAISKGLISKEKAAELSKQEINNLILLPGFSTAEKITNISGRGVGMDVVKTNITRLRGMINIESEKGKGSKFIIKLPLTLAIIPGMIVRVREETVVIPLSSVIEVVKVYTENIHTINHREVIRMRDAIIPLVCIDDLFYKDNKPYERIIQYAVIVGIAEKKFGIKVDYLIGQKEVVIKPLGNYLGNVNAVAGSTIMGDGTVVMILDIGELLNKILDKIE